MAGAKVPAPLDPMVNDDGQIYCSTWRTYKIYDSFTSQIGQQVMAPKIAAGSVIEMGGSPFINY